MSDSEPEPAALAPTPLHAALEDVGIDAHVIKLGGLSLVLYEPNLETAERVSALLEPLGIVLSLDGMQSIKLPGEDKPRNIVERMTAVNLGRTGPTFIAILLDHPDNRAAIAGKFPGSHMDSDHGFAAWVKPRCTLSIAEEVVTTLPRFKFFKRLGKRMGSLGALFAAATASAAAPDAASRS